MKLTVKAGGVPPGAHTAKFLGVEQKESKFGPGIVWKFEVVSGPYAKAKTSGMTGIEPTAQNKCGKFLAGIMGKPLSVDQEIDLQSYVGKMYLVVVEPTDKGGSRITSISLPPT